MKNLISTQTDESRPSKFSLHVIVIFACISLLLFATIIEHSFSLNNTYDNWERFKSYYLKTTTDKQTNVLVLGNSKLFRGLDTSMLNKMSTETRCGLRFYNGGIPGMNSAEFVNSLDLVASNRNFNPSYVLFMPSVFRSKALLLSQRRRNNALLRLWHVNMLNLHARNQPLRAYKNLHLSMLQRAMNKSKLTRKFIFNDIEQRVPMETFTKVQSLDGYLSLDDDPGFGVGHRRELNFKNDVEKYENLVSQLRYSMDSSRRGMKVPNVSITLGGVSDLNSSAKKLLTLYVEKIRSLGAEPITLFFPENSWLPERTFYQKQFSNIKQMIATDEQIEQFIDKNLWYDHEHFNRAGAELFTKMIFKKMCQDKGD